MKTKAYKLAVELGLEEQSLLEWLRSNGYPNVRRADTIRADVCQAARKALGRGGRSSNSRRPQRPTHRPSTRPEPRGVDARGEPRSPEPRGGGGQEGLSVSFAELLESHMPGGVRPPPGKGSPSRKGGRRHNSTRPPWQAPSEAPEPPAPAPVKAPASPRESGPSRDTLISPPSTVDMEMARKLSAAEKAQKEAAEQAEGWRVKFQRARHELETIQGQLPRLEAAQSKADALEAERSRLALEISTLKRQLTEIEGERAALEQTAGDLSQQLSSATARVTAMEKAQAEEEARQQAEAETLAKEQLASAALRESAWRARALELERSASAAISLGTVLSKVGITDLERQARTLQRLLDQPHSARVLIRAMRNIDADAVAQMVRDRVASICADPMCEQVAAQSDLIALRVDDAAQCEICKGSPGRRWFRRMVKECERGGIRRILVVGGHGEIHQSLRELSQGFPVDLRLVSSEEKPELPRVRSRVEGCDVLVVWGEAVVSTRLTSAYLEAAKTEGRLTVHVSGQRCAVDALARSVTHRLARHLILATT